MIEIAGPTTYINKVWQLTQLSSKQWSCSLWSNLAPDLPKTMLEIWYHTCRDKTIQISGFFKLLYTHLINEQTCFLFSLWTFIGSLKRFNVVNDQLPNSMWSAATFYECFVYLFWSFLHVYFLSILDHELFNQLSSSQYKFVAPVLVTKSGGKKWAWFTMRGAAEQQKWERVHKRPPQKNRKAQSVPLG